MSRDVDEVISALAVIIDDLSKHRHPDLDEEAWTNAVINAFTRATNETDLAVVLAYWAEISPDN